MPKDIMPKDITEIDTPKEYLNKDEKPKFRFTTSMFLLGGAITVLSVSTGGVGFLVGLGVAAVAAGAIATKEFYENKKVKIQNSQPTQESYKNETAQEKSHSQGRYLNDYQKNYPLNANLSRATGISNQDIIGVADKGNCFYLALNATCERASNEKISSKDMIIGYLLDKEWTEIDYQNVENAMAKTNEKGVTSDNEKKIFDFSQNLPPEERKARAIDYYIKSENYADSLTITNAADSIGKNIMIFKPGTAESVQIILAKPETTECCPIYYHADKLHYSALDKSQNVDSWCNKILLDARANGANNPYGYAIDLNKLYSISKSISATKISAAPIRPDHTPSSQIVQTKLSRGFN